MRLKKLAVNFHVLTDGILTYWFSYETLVGFEDDNKLLVANNEWGNITGKHLNLINKDKSIRVPQRDIERYIASEWDK